MNEQTLRDIEAQIDSTAPYYVPTLIAEIRRLTAERDEARKDAAFHAECRPNRQQAEAAMADAKATNDRWADEVVRREQAEATIATLRTALTTAQEALRLTEWTPLMGSTLLWCSACGQLQRDGHQRYCKVLKALAQPVLAQEEPS